ncbi:deleted in malignant brain tumors 1 protein-like [Lytechinus variegatus]|uniref:deleted in malignant brain tumors 1 protein-like n=1 Tax=Lytechinus variegatus TaxID=7654 RepID=UPI001BB15BF6|nr:deleted in malignant brain tumors 1 protein-like [Lytechinus variegatus]
MVVCSGVLFSLNDARIVCRMLGYDGALEAGRLARSSHGSGSILFVDCSGSEESLVGCYDVSDATTYCEHKWDAGAICYSGANPNTFQVRLVGGSNHAEGRVEVMHNGSWGTICDDWWDLRDVTVVCKMLGFDGALEAPRSARFGQGSGHILLNYVNCEGTEDNLADCAHPGIGRYSCSHLRDAGAICLPRGNMAMNMMNGMYLELE